jgi:hypothetical protein
MRGAGESPRPGLYVAKVEEVTITGSKDDNGKPDRRNKPMLAVTLVMEKADKPRNERYVGGRVWVNLMLPGHPSFDQTQFKLDQFLQSTKVASKTARRKGTFKTEEQKGKKILLMVRAGTNLDGLYRGEAGQMMPYSVAEFNKRKAAAKDDTDEEEDWEAPEDEELEGDEEDEEEEGDEDEEEDEEEDEDEEEAEEDEDEDEDEDAGDEDEDEEEEADEDEPRLVRMGKQADEGDKSAIKILKKMAAEADINPDDYELWSEVGQELTDSGADEEEEEEEEEEEVEEEEEEEEAPAPRRRRAPAAKKTTARKTTARKTATTRRRAPAKKTTARKTTARRGRKSGDDEVPL